MRTRAAAALAAAAAGASCAAALLALAYALFPVLRIEFAVDPPRLVTGVYPGERDDAAGLTFAWTGPDAAIRLPGLDRRIPWSAELRMRGGRLPPAENPAATVAVDGIRTLAVDSTTEFASVRFDLPPRPDRRRGALITIQSSSTFVPGPSDPRQLGLMLDRVVLRAKGFALPPRDAVAAAAAGGAALAAALALLGLPIGAVLGGAAVLAAGQAAALGHGFAPYTPFPGASARLALAIGAALVAIAWAVEAMRRRPLTATARAALAFTAVALFFKLLVLLHPDMPVGDALFQAHRFQEVLRGSYYFTSIAPGNYLFPYAPGLYVVASPFADFVRREAGDMALLRVVVAATDAVAAGLIYAAVARVWSAGLAALLACVLYQVLPLDFRVASGGTLTSAFAQSVAVAALAVMAAPWTRIERPAGVAALTLVMAAAFLSHTSTFAVLAATGGFVSLMLWWRGGGALRSSASAIAAATAAAVILAVAVYYAHFLETYRTEFARIRGETLSAAPDAGGRSIADRAWIVPLYLYAYFGIPALLLAAAGTVRLWRAAARDRLTLALAGWAMSCAVFLAIGIATPVDLRYYVAALPAVAIAAGAAAAGWWQAGGWRRAAAAALVAWAVWIGIDTWFDTLA